MAPKLEDLKGSGGSVRIGTTGTIGSLMTKELDMKTTPEATTPRRKSSTVSVSVPCGAVNSPRKLQPKTTSNEASTSESSGGSSNKEDINYRQSIGTQKPRRSARKGTHHMPILTSENVAGEITPNREKKAEKKASKVVEVVDIRCSYPNKWSSPIPNRFKKLNPSKLSQTIV